MNGVQWVDPGWAGIVGGCLVFAAGLVLLVRRVRRQRRENAEWEQAVVGQGPVRAAFQVRRGQWHPCDGPRRADRESGFAVGRASVVPRPRDGHRG